MKLEVEVTSNEIIKPSSPIPDHPGIYHFSFLDQISPKVYSPVVFYYEYEQRSNLDIVEISDKLKKSLSHVLTIFYPLAGRVKDNRFVDCNDAGIPFFEARVECRLSDLLGDPNPNELCNLLPFRLYEVTELALGVQINVFRCGGIAVGLCISHQIADAYSVVMFVKSWVAAARGEEVLVRPEFTAATLFPPRDANIGYDPSKGIEKHNMVTKRFVFNSSAIKALRAKHEERKTSENNGDIENYQPSRVELLSAFIWSRFVASTVADADDCKEKFYTVIHAVNLRPRFEPPLPEERSFGNMFRLGLVFLSSSGNAASLEESSYGLLRKIREGIKRVDEEYVKRVLQQGSLVDVAFVNDRARRLMAERGERVVTLSFSSLCRFPLYEVEFGWGEPKWVSSTAIPFENSVGFMDSKEGDGIEAYITLNQQAMPKFELDKEFCQLISPSNIVCLTHEN